MRLKELNVKEALQLLAEKYPEPVMGYHNRYKCELKGVILNQTYCFDVENCEGKHGVMVDNFSIEVPEEYRYMTNEEQGVWVITVGYKNHQMKHKETNKWGFPFICGNTTTEEYEYRTVELIDGKIVYGEPQEFKVRV